MHLKKLEEQKRIDSHPNKKEHRVIFSVMAPKQYNKALAGDVYPKTRFSRDKTLKLMKEMADFYPFFEEVKDGLFEYDAYSHRTKGYLKPKIEGYFD